MAVEKGRLLSPLELGHHFLLPLNIGLRRSLETVSSAPAQSSLPQAAALALHSRGHAVPFLWPALALHSRGRAVPFLRPRPSRCTAGGGLFPSSGRPWRGTAGGALFPSSGRGPRAAQQGAGCSLPLAGPGTAQQGAHCSLPQAAALALHSRGRAVPFLWPALARHSRGRAVPFLWPALTLHSRGRAVPFLRPRPSCCTAGGALFPSSGRGPRAAQQGAHCSPPQAAALALHSRGRAVPFRLEEAPGFPRRRLTSGRDPVSVSPSQASLLSPFAVQTPWLGGHVVARDQVPGGTLAHVQLSLGQAQSLAQAPRPPLRAPHPRPGSPPASPRPPSARRPPARLSAPPTRAPGAARGGLTWLLELRERLSSQGRCRRLPSAFPALRACPGAQGPWVRSGDPALPLRTLQTRYFLDRERPPPRPPSSHELGAAVGSADSSGGFWKVPEGVRPRPCQGTFPGENIPERGNIHKWKLKRPETSRQ
ncbi:uncharacterized protein LOC144340210 [Macaca mulatta]